MLKISLPKNWFALLVAISILIAGWSLISDWKNSRDIPITTPELTPTEETPALEKEGLGQRQEEEKKNSNQIDSKMSLKLIAASSPTQSDDAKKQISENLLDLERQPSLYSPPTLLLASRAYYSIVNEEKAVFWFHAALSRLKEDLKKEKVSDPEIAEISQKLTQPILELTRKSNFKNPNESLETQQIADAWNEVTPRNYDPKVWVENISPQQGEK